MNLDEVAAREAIREVLARYYRAMDRVDDELGYSIFHADGTADYGEDIVVGAGREAIDHLNAYNRTLVASHHAMSNVTISVSGDRASSEAYVTATLLTVDAENGGHVVRRVYGRYIDRFSRRDGVWLIDHRYYRRDFFWEERGHDVWLGESSARTGADASYEILAWPTSAR